MRVGVIGKILLIAASLSGCVHPKIQFQKAYLLDPAFDPAKTEGLYRGMLAVPRVSEKGSVDGGKSSGASCPTCGG